MNEPIVYGVSWAVVDVSDPQWEHAVSWDIYELAGTEMDGTPYYSLSMETGLPSDGTNDIHKVKPWATITIKWDGCSHLNFKDDGYYHVCGYDDWKQWSELIKDLFLRSAEKMKTAGNNLLDDAFPTKG